MERSSSAKVGIAPHADEDGTHPRTAAAHPEKRKGPRVRTAVLAATSYFNFQRAITSSHKDTHRKSKWSLHAPSAWSFSTGARKQEVVHHLSLIHI